MRLQNLVGGYFQTNFLNILLVFSIIPFDANERVILGSKSFTEFSFSFDFAFGSPDFGLVVFLIALLENINLVVVNGTRDRFLRKRTGKAFVHV
jgi:hypothetical protein